MSRQVVPPVPTASAGLIGDWAGQVMELWEESRIPGAAIGMGELGAACRVRAQLNNRLHCLYPGPEETPGSLEMLRSADELFRQFTIESRSAANLSSHNHYAHQGEWWWRRLPRLRLLQS